MKHTVSELTGAFLDRAVCLAEGWTPNAGGGWHQPIMIEVGEDKPWVPQTPFFSFDWCLAGPIIEREKIGLWATDHCLGFDIPGGPKENYGAERREPGRLHRVCFGPTPLTAAMRAYVASKFGDTIEL